MINPINARICQNDSFGNYVGYKKICRDFLLLFQLKIIDLTSPDGMCFITDKKNITTPPPVLIFFFGNSVQLSLFHATYRAERNSFFNMCVENSDACYTQDF